MFAKLYQLLACPTLPRNARLRGEDQLTIAIANYLRQLSLTGQLKAVWFHPPNEGKRSRMVGVISKAMGLLPGTPDLVVMAKHTSLLVEIKTPDGRLNDNQKIFREWCLSTGVPWYRVESVDDLANILRQHDLIQENTNAQQLSGHHRQD